MQRFSNILLVVDERTDYSAALKRSATLARKNQARLTVCTIVDTVPSEVRMGVITIAPREVLGVATAKKRAWLEDAVDPAAIEGVSVSTKVLVGKPFIQIIRQVLRNDHDLIIKCADADSGLREMLFSSTDKHLMRKCPCPVWIIKPTERQKYLRILAASSSSIVSNSASEKSQLCDLKSDSPNTSHACTMCASLYSASAIDVDISRIWRLSTSFTGSSGS